MNRLKRFLNSVVIFNAAIGFIWVSVNHFEHYIELNLVFLKVIEPVLETVLDFTEADGPDTFQHEAQLVKKDARIFVFEKTKVSTF